MENLPPPPPAADEEYVYQDTICLGSRGGDLSKEKGLDPFPPWAFIRFICIGMQIKLINPWSASKG